MLGEGAALSAEGRPVADLLGTEMFGPEGTLRRVLLAGLDAWTDEVLFPVQPTDPTPEEARRFSEAVAVAKLFGGRPRAAASAGGGALAHLPDLAPAAPAVVVPSLPAGASAPAKNKRREGC